MSGAIRAELLRITRKPSSALILFIAVVADAVSIAGNGAAMTPNALFQLTFGAVIFSMILGALSSTSEFQNRTAGRTLLAVGSVPRALGAKVIAATIACFAFAVVTTGSGLLVAYGTVTAHGHHLALNGDVLKIGLGVTLIVTLGGPWGALIGWVARNQIGAILGLVLWTVIVETALQAWIPDVSRFLPGGALSAVSLDPELPQRLTQVAGIALFAGWLAAAGVVATLSTTRREIG